MTVSMIATTKKVQLLAKIQCRAVELLSYWYIFHARVRQLLAETAEKTATKTLPAIITASPPIFLVALHERAPTTVADLSNALLGSEKSLNYDCIKTP